MGTIRVISGSATGHSAEVDRELVIGREDVDLSLADGEASRRHAALRPVPGGIAIRDLGSLNGTFVNGKRITDEVVVSRNATVRIGTTEIAVEFPSTETVMVPATPVADRNVTVAGSVPMASAPPAAPSPPPPAAPSPPPQAAPSPPPGVPLGYPTPPPPEYRVAAAGPPGRDGPPGPGGKPGRAALLRKKPWVPILGLVIIAAIVAGVLIATNGSKSSVATAHAATSHATVDEPVEFTVTDEDRSLLRCPTTGATYVVQGRLVAPASGPGASATLYLSGVILSGLFEWHYDLVPGYDYARALAALGHTSVVVDRVGYGKTVPYPANGDQDCLGAQADEMHQIVGQLRSGSYIVPGSSGVKPKAFARIGMAGYSIGGIITELEAGSFHDVNAAAIVSIANQDMTNYGTSFAEIPKLCFPGSSKPPGGRMGYFRTLPLAKLAPLLSRQADPRVVASLTQYAQLDPCGDLLTGESWFTGVDSAARAAIKVPVLVIHGDFDVLFNPPAWRAEYNHFTGTHDKTLIGLPVGQLVMLDRDAATFQQDMARWLAARGL